jgi:hypothetical protein
MKKYTFALSFLLVVLILTLTQSFSGDQHGTKSPTGAPAGHTGSPGDAKNCTVCHGGTATPISGILTSNVPPTGYLAGETYDFTVALSGAGRKGFQASPQNVAGALLGTLIAGQGNQVVGFNKYVTHTAASNAATATWNFQWTAPTTPGTGDVTMYIAGVISQPNVRLSSLLLNENYNVGIDEREAGVARIYPNPGSGSLFLDMNLKNQGMLKAEVFTLSGQKANFSLEQQIQEGNSNISLNHNLSPGTYILRLSTPDGQSNRKLVVL